MGQESALLHQAFKNTHFILYLVPRHASPTHLADPPGLATTKGTRTGAERGVKVYTRCIYCAAGGASLRLLYTWKPSQTDQLSTSFFPGPLRSLQGHRLRIVSMEWFPFIDYKRHTPEGGAVVTPRDSLDYRMLKEISKRLNFTYEMRAPWDNQWGTSTSSGNWTGVVGTLQHQKADFSMMLSYMPTRLSIVHYSGIYASEPLVMVTSKPRPLSQASALIRPFSVEVWVVTLVSAVASGVVLWGLQRVWAWAAGCEGLELSRAMMTTWGILLEDPPIKLPSNMTGQMVVGWWWVYCMLLTIVYRSSLIAHLTVPGQSPTLESLADLLKANRRERWTWGYEPTYGSGWEWLKINENPTVRTVFKSLMVSERKRKVVTFSHTFTMNSSSSYFFYSYSYSSSSYYYYYYYYYCLYLIHALIHFRSYSHRLNTPNPMLPTPTNTHRALPSLSHTRLQVVDLDEQLARVIRGRHAFITWKYYIRSVVAARYKGASPLHTAREELFNYGGYGWGFRRGAPFRSLVDDLQGRLVESGLVTTWLDQLVEAGMTARLPEPATPTLDTQLLLSQQEGAARVILGLGHLQGIFYLLGFGLALAFATFLAELLPFCRPEDTHKPFHLKFR
ncbi:uncharacterized protein LOC126992340 isoform X2 [Eriocheir sinensis]|uniref:uncharacterized protein LOC126992340 isoform X2 n=1 Tax=Eriocheir sinensis TaxID=95602 RepID=UPI0021C8B99F|nr:uncharacterized protein LOC126992340 isoform X2 [Eriocheir sinensis]